MQTDTPAAAALRRHRFALFLMWLTPLMWSSNYIIARAANGVIAPHMLALGRWGLALLLMLPFAWSGLVAARPHWRREWKQMLVLGALGMWICGAIVYLGAQTTSAVNIGLIYAAAPVAIAFFGARLLHETVTPVQRVGMLLAFSGVVFVIAKGDAANLLSVRFTAGDGWILLAMASWVAYTVLQQRWPSALGASARLAAITMGGVVVLLPFTLAEALLTDLPPFSLQALGLVVLAAVLPGFLSYRAYAFMLQELGTARAGLVLYLGPVYAAGTAWALLGEPPQWFHGVGAALILPSIYLATRGRRPPA